MSSCIDTLEDQGFWINSESKGVAIYPDKTGIAIYIYANYKRMIALKYIKQTIKRIVVKYSISVSASGAITTTYKCGAGLALKRLVMWAIDPMEKLFQSMHQLVTIMVLIQLLNSMIGGLI